MCDLNQMAIFANPLRNFFSYHGSTIAFHKPGKNDTKKAYQSCVESFDKIENYRWLHATQLLKKQAEARKSREVFRFGLRASLNNFKPLLGICSVDLCHK